MTNRSKDYSTLPLETLVLRAEEFERAKELYQSSFCYSDWRGMMAYHGLPKTQAILRWVNDQEKLGHIFH